VPSQECDRFQQQLSSAFASGDRVRSVVGIAMKAGHRQDCQITNEFVRIKF
jgi:hypothetical protein